MELISINSVNISNIELDYFEDEARAIMEYYIGYCKACNKEPIFENMFALMDNSDTIVLFGLEPYIFPVMYVYILPTKRLFLSNVRDFISICKIVLDDIFSNGINRIECHVADNKKHIKFVKYLGFKRDAELKNFGPNCENYFLYSLCKGAANMESLFERAFEDTIKKEGGYVNDPNDNGGETKYGISRRSYPGIDIKNISLDDARKIYYKDFWLKNKCGSINCYALSNKLFDLSVNMGTSQAARLLQRAIIASGLDIVDDGVVGPITINAIKNLNPQIILAALKSEAAGFYRLLAINDKTQYSFLEGWLRRAYA
jgi:hypothetical protein